ncbi:hypothetical protein BGX27_009553 [Mortierella sp. AM989]|nr:hypothetical protein BGX27_009553 [Mortierella sp. AM989]
MTPPNHGHPNMHMHAMATTVSTRQRSMSTSTPGPGSPISVPGSSYPTKSSDTPKRPSIAVSQSSLPPSRSLSLINILNAPETEGSSDTTETEEDTVASPMDTNRVSRSRDYAEHGQPYVYHQESGHQAGMVAAHPEPISANTHMEQLVAPDNSFVEIRHESQQHADQHDGKGLRVGNEKIPRPGSKEKPSQKEKPVKAPKPVKKSAPIKMPPKKKAIVSSAGFPILEASAAIVDNDIRHSTESVPHVVQDSVTGLKHDMDEIEKDREDSAVKKVRVDGYSTPEIEKNNPVLRSPPASQQHGESTSTSRQTPIQRLKSSQSGLPSGGDDHIMSTFENTEQVSTRVQGSPRQKKELISSDGNKPRLLDIVDETEARPLDSINISTMTPSASISAPTSGSVTGRPKPLPETDHGHQGKKSSNEGHYDNSSPSPLIREPLKGAKPDAIPAPPPPPLKEKKTGKKKSAIETSQPLDDLVATNKPSKNIGTQKESEGMDMDIVDNRNSGKSTLGGKKSMSSQSPHNNSLKKRFSKSVESISGLIEEPKHSEAIKVIISENAEVSLDKATVESTRDKSVKGKRVDRAEPTPISSLKSENLKSQQPFSRSKESLPSLDSPPTAGQSQTDEEKKLYCICKMPYYEGCFMIQCDGCDDWFHGDCVGVAEKDSKKVDKYYCKRCEDKGRHASGKKTCIREPCQRPAARRSKYCSRECGLLLATQRIHESQAKAFGSPIHTDDNSTAEHHPPEQAQQQLQRRRRLTLADLDDRQRLLGIREKMSHVRKVCSILDAREKQLVLCVDRQMRQDLGKLVFPLSSSIPSNSAVDKEGEKAIALEEEEEEDIAPRYSGSNSSKSKPKGKSQKTKDKDKDKESFCGFDYSLVWDDAQDMSRIDRAALTSLATTPTGSRASSVAPPSFGVVLVAAKKQSSLGEDLGNQGKSRNSVAALSPDERSIVTDTSDSSLAISLSHQLEEVGLRVCMSRRQCDRHNGWQKLKAAELDLEKTLQNKLLKALKSEAKLVKNRMKRRRNDLSAGLLNGTIEHRPIK